ncbi:integrase core domain-containing protein, partial [Tamlana crocina]|uniref:integrase core domain-containing protein n=1 Tax=Tamlana crocina TaxID=393006 RepID=UPI001FD79267
SMSRKGNCWDNAVAESFFKSLKVEWIYRHSYRLRSEAELSIFLWIETWYNNKRRHSFLGNKTIGLATKSRTFWQYLTKCVKFKYRGLQPSIFFFV